MKRFAVILVLFLLAATGCAQTRSPHLSSPAYKAVTPVGNVPAAFEQIVKDNLFADATAFTDRLLKWEYTEHGYLISMYDFSGKLIASHSCTTDIDTFHISSLIATSDGGFLFGLGFYDHYNADEQAWESEKGVYSRIIKCNADGQTQWDVKLENYTNQMLRECIELNGAYYFFGAQETPQTNTTGVSSPSDIHMMILDTDGSIKKASVLAGSDYDMFYNVNHQSDTFILQCRSQSKDGDYSDANYDTAGMWEISLDANLQVLEMKQIEHDCGDYVGILDNNVIMSKDAILSNYPDGRVTALLDYGDYYLIISENITGIYENTPPTISSLWYYTETVYAAYDKQGILLWKAAVDSTPPYDQMIGQFYS